MKQLKKTIPTVFMKTKNLQLTMGVVMSLACSNNLHAQNTSYDTNAVPIGGTHNCGLGAGALSASVPGSVENVGVGIFALLSNTTGYHNVATGYQALYTNSTGNDNVANGHTALWKNTTGYYNVGVGTGALSLTTTANNNVAVGFAAISAMSTATATGSQNVGIGSNALTFNLSGGNNVAVGFNSLYSNTSGSLNVGIGYNALYTNTTGSYNVATGPYALTNNISGFYNSAYGYQALQGTTAGNNTSMGFRSLYLNTTGADNTGMGFGALYTNLTGARNTSIGSGADVSTGALTNATAVGYGAVVNLSNKVRIGNATVTVIEGAVPFTPSDGRFKTDIKEEDVKGLEFIKKLRPVVYNFDTKKLTEFWTKNMPDTIRSKYMNQDFTASTNIRQSGFIAQEVEQAAKEVNYNFNGLHVPENENDNYSIAYGQFVVPLVKAVQEQQKIIEDLQQQVNELQKGKGSTTGIDQVSVVGASMEQNAPNPFSHETVIRFNLPGQIGNAFMTVYDLSGKQIKTLPISQRGNSSITITSDQLEAGIYIYSIMADGKLVDSKRMVVMDK